MDSTIPTELPFLSRYMQVGGLWPKKLLQQLARYNILHIITVNWYCYRYHRHSVGLTALSQAYRCITVYTALNYSFNALTCMTLGDQALVLGERDCLLDCDFCACTRYKWARLTTVNPFSTELKRRRRTGMHTDNELNPSGMRMVAIHYCIIPTCMDIALILAILRK